MDLEKLKQAGEIHKSLVEYAKSIIKPKTPLLEIANKIDEKIEELGAKPAFPINLSINEIAAHATPTYNDETLAHGLLKVDIGIHIDGYVADGAFSVDLENSEENKNLIKASQEALSAALNTISPGVTLSEIGRSIETEMKKHNCQPIQNLCGHSIEQYDLHAGISIPNIENSSPQEIEEGTYAIEPFSTLASGTGSVRDGKLSGIYKLDSEGAVRDPNARELLKHIKEEYNTLPFCSRWLVKKFGSRALLSLKRLEDAGVLHHYPQLIEKSGSPVAQAEHTIVLTEGKKIITTL